jgi:hypothetical protein
MSKTKPATKPVYPSNSMISTRPMFVPSTQTFLQALSCQVTYCIKFRIQPCHLPKSLKISTETYFLNHEIQIMQTKLKALIRKDYEVQKAAILLERKKGIDK